MHDLPISQGVDKDNNRECQAEHLPHEVIVGIEEWFCSMTWTESQRACLSQLFIQLVCDVRMHNLLGSLSAHFVSTNKRTDRVIPLPLAAHACITKIISSFLSTFLLASSPGHWEWPGDEATFLPSLLSLLHPSLHIGAVLVAAIS